MWLEPKNRKLREAVMRRVYVIWLVRQVFRPIFLKIVGLAAVVWQMSVYVSFNRVLLNVQSVNDWFGYYQFWREALSKTESIVQVLVLASVVLAVWLMKDGLANMPRLRLGR